MRFFGNSYPIFVKETILTEAYISKEYSLIFLYERGISNEGNKNNHTNTPHIAAFIMRMIFNISGATYVGVPQRVKRLFGVCTGLEKVKSETLITLTLTALILYRRKELILRLVVSMRHFFIPRLLRGTVQVSWRQFLYIAYFPQTFRTHPQLVVKRPLGFILEKPKSATIKPLLSSARNFKSRFSGFKSLLWT